MRVQGTHQDELEHGDVMCGVEVRVWSAETRLRGRRLYTYRRHLGRSSHEHPSSPGADQPNKQTVRPHRTTSHHGASSAAPLGVSRISTHFRDPGAVPVR